MYAIQPLDGEEALSEVGVFYPMVCLEYGNLGGWSFYGFAYMGFRCVLKMNIGTSQRAQCAQTIRSYFTNDLE